MKNLPQHIEKLEGAAEALTGNEPIPAVLPDEVSQDETPPITEEQALIPGDILSTDGIASRDLIEQEVLNDPEYQNINNEYDFQQEVKRRREYRAKKLEPQNIPGTPVVPNIPKGETQTERELLTDKLFNTFLAVSEHENGFQYADMLINNIISETNDFGKGELYEHVKVTDLLPRLLEVYPDIDRVEDPTNNTPRDVSPTAEKLKNFLKELKDRENHPLLWFGKDAVNVTGESFKEGLIEAPQHLGLKLIGLMSKTAEWGIGDVVKDQYKMEGLSEEEAEKRKKEFFDLSGYFWQPDLPDTLLGQLALSGGEFGLAYATGTRLYNAVAAPMKAIFPEIAGMIGTSTGLSTPGGAMAAKEVMGGTLIGSKEERLVRVLQMLGVGGEGPRGNWIDYIAGSEDDNIFEDRLKQFVDSVYTGVGMSTLAPLIMMTGKAGYHATKGSAKKADKLLKHGASFANRLFHNYPVEDAMRMDLGGPKAVKLDEVKRVLDQANEAIFGQATTESGKNLVKKMKNLIKKGTGGTPEKIDTTVSDMLRDKGYQLGDDSIQPIIKTETTSFLQPIKGRNMEEVIIDSVKLLEGEPLHFKKILEQNEKYFPGLFNLKNINDTNRKQAIAEAAVHYTNIMENQIKSHGETVLDGIKVREELEFMFGDQLDTYFKEFAGTTDVLPGTLYALRQYVVEESIPYMASTKAVATAAKQVAEGTLKSVDKKLLLRYYIDTVRFLDILGAEVKFSGNIGRTLESLKAGVGVTDDLLDNIILGAKDGSLEGEDLLINIAQTVDKYTDITQLINGAKPKGKIFTLFQGINSWAVSGLLSGVKTLAAGPLGYTTYTALKTGENYLAAGYNKAGKLIYKATSRVDPKTGRRVGGNKIAKYLLGTGKGVTKAQADAYAFGLTQAFLEVLGGTGYFQAKAGLTTQAGKELVERSPFGEGWRVMKSLDLGDQSSKHEMIKMFEGSTDVITFPIVGDIVMAKGVNGAAIEKLLGLDKQGLQGHLAPFLKMLANGAGFINSANARIIMSQDGFMRTITERAEMHMNAMAKAENKLRVQLRDNPDFQKSLEFNEESLFNEYFSQVRNFRNSPDMIEKGKEAARVAVMQQRKRGGYISKIENFKTDIGDTVGDIPANLARSYVASKLSFIRTMANIYKQTLTERGLVKLSKGLGLSRKEARKFANDEKFKQFTLAQTTTGLLILGAGIGAANHWFDTEEKEIYMEGVDTGDEHIRSKGGSYISMSIGKPYGPQIIVRDLNSGKKTFIPIERLDMGKAPLVLGAIMGSTYRQFLEANAKVKSKTVALQGQREADELWFKFARAMGDFLMDLPTAQGIKDTAHNMIPTMGPEWRPGKELADFFTWIGNPVTTGGASMFASIKKAGEDVRFQRYQDQKTYMEGFEGGHEEQRYETKGGTFEYLTDAGEITEIGKKLGILQTFWNRMKDLHERTSIIDMRDPENPVVGQDLYAMVDPEGYLLKYLPDETVSKLSTALQSIAIPFYPMTERSTPTTDLIIAFGIDYDHPNDWNHYNNYNLSPEQKYHWSVLAGRKNKEYFSDPEWQEFLLQDRLGYFEENFDKMEEKNDIKLEIEDIIDDNRREALEEMLAHERNRSAEIYFDNAASQLPAEHSQADL